MRRGEIVPVTFGLDGGLNIHDDPTSLEDNQLQVCKNFNIYKKRLEKRNSFASVTAPGAAASCRTRWIGQYHTPSVTQLFLAVENSAAAAAGVYFTANGGSSWTQVGSFTGHFYRAFHYSDFMYFFDTGGNVRVWDGSTVVTSAAILANYIPGDIVLDRMFMWGYQAFTQTIRYSDPGAMGTFPSINSIAVPYNEPADTVTALVGYKDRLVIFKKNNIQILHLTGTPINWQLKKFIDGIGNTGLYSVCKAEDWIYFIDRKGVYRTNLSTIEEISGPIKSAFADRKSIINNAVGSSITAYGLYDSIAYYRNMIICSVNVIKPAATASSRRHRIFVFHIDTEVWTEWVPNITSDDSNDFNPPLNMMTVEETSIASATYSPYPSGVYCGSMELNGQLFRYSPFNSAPFTDYDGQYDCELRTKSFLFDTGMELKKFPAKSIDVVADDAIRMNVTDVVEGVELTPIVKAAGTYVGNTKIRGPGYVREYALDVLFDVPSGTDDTGLIVDEFGMAVRMPRPIQPKDLV